MGDSIIQAYRYHLYSVPENAGAGAGAGAGNQPLLKFHPSVDGEQKERLSEFYFYLPFYRVGSETSTPPEFGGSPIANFTFMPTVEVSKSFRNSLITKFPEDINDISDSSFSSLDNIDNWFSGKLKEACLEAAVRKTDPDSPTGELKPEIAIDSIQASFYRRYLLGEEAQDESDDILTTTNESIEATYENPSALRPYFAWRYIDIMFPGSERNEYFLVQRVHLLTKVVFIMAMLHPKADANDVSGGSGRIEEHSRFSVVIDIIGRLIVFLIKESLVYTSIGDPTTDISIDDDAQRNSELSHKIHNNSKTLIRNKNIVQKTQDNLRSLVNVDSYVKSTRKVAWYTMLGLIVLLVLAVASMAFSYARGRTGEMYLVAGVIVLGVVAFEAFKGVEKLFALPVSVFE